MNREDRRRLGVSKSTSDSYEKYNSPCTITEAVQISRASAEDVVTDALNEYQRRTSPLQVAMSLQMEILKDVVINAGLISKKEFSKRYSQKAEEFNEMQKLALNNRDENPKMEISANDIEVKTEE